MARWSERWKQNEDGSYSRNVGGVPDYSDMSKDELSAELERRGLPKTGNKPDLIARLQESDMLVEA